MFVFAYAHEAFAVFVCVHASVLACNVHYLNQILCNCTIHVHTQVHVYIPIFAYYNLLHVLG